MTTFRTVSFEDNDLSHPLTGFDCVAIKGGTIEVAAAAALVGSYGCAMTPLNGYAMYAYVYYPVCRRFRFSFYWNQNTFALDDAGYFYTARPLGYMSVFYLSYIRAGSTYYLKPEAYDDAVGVVHGTSTTVPAGTHHFEIDWKASSAPGANDGFMRFWKDDVSVTQPAALETLDNDTVFVTNLTFPGYSAAAFNSNGTYYLDQIRANNDGTVIGA